MRNRNEWHKQNCSTHFSSAQTFPKRFRIDWDKSLCFTFNCTEIAWNGNSISHIFSDRTVSMQFNRVKVRQQQLLSTFPINSHFSQQIVNTKCFISEDMCQWKQLLLFCHCDNMMLLFSCVVKYSAIYDVRHVRVVRRKQSINRWSKFESNEL